MVIFFDSEVYAPWGWAVHGQAAPDLPFGERGGENVLQLRFGQPAEGSVRSYSAGAHLQRTGETIAPSSFNAFMALSTSFRSKPLSSAIFPAFRGVLASFIVFNTISLAFIMFVYLSVLFLRFSVMSR